jgi:hypothetical protein
VLLGIWMCVCFVAYEVSFSGCESLFVFAACLATSPEPDTPVGGVPTSRHPLRWYDANRHEIGTETVSVFAGFRGYCAGCFGMRPKVP